MIVHLTADELEASRDTLGAFPAPPLPFRVREYDPATDKHYVLDSWLKSRLADLRKKYPGKRMSIKQRHEWFAATRPVFAATLENAASTVLIACDPEKPERILGWLVSMGSEHYAHVKAWCDPFRDLILGELYARAGLEMP